MKRSSFFFNGICIFLIVGALFGTLWISRGTLRTWWYHENSSDVPVALTRSEIQKQIQTSTGSLLSQVNIVLPKDVTSTKPVVSGIPIKGSTSTVSETSVIVSSSTSSSIPKSIPPEINLAVPFVPQAPEKNWEQPWQDACEEAAILMIDAYYKDVTTSILWDKEEISKMVKWEEDLGWGLSIEISKIQKIFSDYLEFSDTIKIIENPTIDQIKKYVANGQPVLVVADGKILPNPHFQNGGPSYHALVIRGYTKDSFITNDPGTQFGENFKYKYDDLMNAIRDWNGGGVKSGRRVVLVVE
jgi:hypothetical protein